ncbi:MAG: FAD-dependent monooxygenase [Candidatus Marinimicrobia bacterium]|nr:FAD-dependent monooxygenase [Candidatus Neomarinimicrobiota bacterium]
MAKKITLIGAGLTGPLLATYLANRGYTVDIYERRSDMRNTSINAGRSINLALSVRGIHALKEVGLFEKIDPMTIAMKGRMIHDLDGTTHLQRYGQKPEEVIYSVSRAKLNMELMTLAEETGKVNIHFNQKCIGMDLDEKMLSFFDKKSDNEKEIPFDLVMGVDGSASAVRDAMISKGNFNFEFKPLGHGYKELTIPPGENGDFQWEPNALHIWPRGLFMLIALPNIDRSFTCTLFFPMEGAVSFESVQKGKDIEGLFHEQFPDAFDLLPHIVDQFQQNPIGHLGSVYCDPWHVENKAVLLGDAAHAVVPFFGQGMNASFQDCSVLNNLMIKYPDNWEIILSEFSKQHVPNGHAIADMAVENYLEMRDHVNNPRYKKRRELELKMECMFPEKFTPRYSMVSFHQIPYANVYARGEEQYQLLDAILDKYELDDVNETIARNFIG